MAKSRLPLWVYGVLTGCGLVMVASMFAPWIEVARLKTFTGFELAWHRNTSLFLVPLTGVVLLSLAAARSDVTRWAAIAAGLAVSGYVMFHVSKSLVFDGGMSTWLVLGGAGAMLAGTSSSHRAWRVVGGIAVVAGFVAPWDQVSMLTALRSHEISVVATRAGITVGVLWLVPVAAIAGIVSGLLEHRRAGTLSLMAGVTVIGAIVWTLASVLNLFLGLGAWAALAASAAALVLGVLAPSRRPSAAPSP